MLAMLAVAGCSSSKPADAVSSATSAAGSVVSSATSAAGSVVSSITDSSSSSGMATSGSASSGSSSPSIVAPTKASKNYKIAFIQGVQGDEFYITMQCGIEAEAKRLGVTVTTQGPKQFDPTLQRPILDSVVQTKPDAILIAPTDVQALQQPLADAAKSGIKIVLVDTTTQDPSFAVSQVSSDNVGGGAAAFKAIQELSPNGGKVMVESVNPGISTTDQRNEGFQNAVKADSKFTSVGVQYSKDDPATATQQVAAQLQKDPDLVGVFGANLFAAEGAATAVRQSGKTNQVKIVGFDAGPGQVKDLKGGIVQALVAQQPGQIGTYGLDQAVAALDGGQVTPKIQTGFTILTKDNVDSSGAAYKASC
ncbi:ribose ABC transporter substrate-binding protein [Nakamurella endophytica]|uniref:Ribose ABC transporter substrate-binding protein n=1 Tax=Nakamurella endophytica TaxID=1748367 RepID=A0A917WK23_9ACTN|nr:ribose ABC transporter substrate-binding protein [Nakamurella endophytica]